MVRIGLKYCTKGYTARLLNSSWRVTRADDNAVFMNVPPNMTGALLMMASMASFTLNDSLIKSTGGALPLMQLLLLRGVLSTFLIFYLKWLDDWGASIPLLVAFWSGSLIAAPVVYVIWGIYIEVNKQSKIKAISI